MGAKLRVERDQSAACRRGGTDETYENQGVSGTSPTGPSSSVALVGGGCACLLYFSLHYKLGGTLGLCICKPLLGRTSSSPAWWDAMGRKQGARPRSRPSLA